MFSSVRYAYLRMRLSLLGLGYLSYALSYFFTMICHILTSSCNHGCQVPKTIPSHLPPNVCLHSPTRFPNSLYNLRRDMQIKRLRTNIFLEEILVIRNRSFLWFDFKAVIMFDVQFIWVSYYLKIVKMQEDTINKIYFTEVAQVYVSIIV